MCICIIVYEDLTHRPSSSASTQLAHALSLVFEIWAGTIRFYYKLIRHMCVELSYLLAASKREHNNMFVLLYSNTMGIVSIAKTSLTYFFIRVSRFWTLLFTRPLIVAFVYSYAAYCGHWTERVGEVRWAVWQGKGQQCAGRSNGRTAWDQGHWAPLSGELLHWHWDGLLYLLARC